MMTYKVEVVEIEIQYYIFHDTNAILSFCITLKPIAVEYHIHMKWIDFLDGYLTAVAISHATTLGVRVSLT